MRKIPWWQTEFASGEAEAASSAIASGRLSQGPIVAEFENRLREYLGVRNVIATTSGSDALLLALWATGVRPGDEVLVPNRTWIATAHSVLLLGAVPVIVDTDSDRPVISLVDLERKVSEKTRVVIPVHMNGRDAHIDEVLKFGDRYKLKVIEDAAQALGSKDLSGAFLGTKSLAGCFSLSVAKVISSGQGGFITSNDDEFATRLRRMRTHGVENVVEPKNWGLLGFNFRFTDVLASIGMEQLKKLDKRLNRLRQIHQKYQSGLASLTTVSLIDVQTSQGEIGPYIEVLCKDRSALVAHLNHFGVETRIFYPDVNKADYMSRSTHNPNSERFGRDGLYLPSGPALHDESIDFVVKKIKEFDG
jgi:dTDP-4-amino-4,6-dideoxygalactose transaminase